MIRINLLPTKAAQKKESVILQLVVGAVFIFSALVVCWWVDRGKAKEVADVQTEINQLNEELRQLDTIIKQVEEYKRKRLDLNRKIDTIRKLNAQRSGPVKFLEEFGYVIPRKAWVSTFREVGKQVTLEGIATDGPTVSDFIDNLRGSSFFHNVQLIQVQQASHSGKKVVRYNINCRVNYTPAGNA